MDTEIEKNDWIDQLRQDIVKEQLVKPPIALLKKMNKARTEIGYIAMAGVGQHGKALSASQLNDKVNGILVKLDISCVGTPLNSVVTKYSDIGFSTFKGVKQPYEKTVNFMTQDWLFTYTNLDMNQPETLRVIRSLSNHNTGSPQDQGALETLLFKYLFKSTFSVASDELDLDVFNARGKTQDQLEEEEREKKQKELNFYLKKYKDALKEHGITAMEFEKATPKFISDLRVLKTTFTDDTKEHNFLLSVKKLADEKKNKATKKDNAKPKKEEKKEKEIPGEPESLLED